MSLPPKIASWIERNPLIIIRFNASLSEDIHSSRNGLFRFSLTREHSLCDDIKPPVLCLCEMVLEGKKGYYIGIIKAKAAVSTFDTRLLFRRLTKLHLQSLEKLTRSIPSKQLKGILSNKLSRKDFACTLSPKLSASVLEVIDAEDSHAIQSIHTSITGGASLLPIEQQQNNLCDLAKKIFDIDLEKPSKEDAENFQIKDSYDDEYLWEDNVIAADSSTLPGFKLIEKTLTGVSTFRKGKEQLTIYTANRTLLEKMLGVDLIYVNQSRGNIVMVQIKMLEPEKAKSIGQTSWTLRPDKQLAAEMRRMVLPGAKSLSDDYRLSENPFYFKFVKRHLVDNGQSFVITIDHLKNLLKSPKMKGPKGGVCISYEALDGTYLREHDFVSLVRSGYIGTHQSSFSALEAIIKSVSSGNRAVVLAWQQKIKRSDEA